MAKKSQKIAGNQSTFDFEARLESYRSAREDVMEACRIPESTAPVGTPAEAAVEIAAAAKRSIRKTGLSREQVVDEVNTYFGADILTIHKLNHYLSKPAQYPLPSIYIFPLVAITGSLGILQVLADPVGARVISGEEVRQMALGKLEEMMAAMSKLKREIKGGRA